jgi:hypothetical protein
MPRCAAVDRPERALIVHIRPALQEEAHDIQVALQCRRTQSFSVVGAHVSSAAHEELRELQVPILCSNDQRIRARASQSRDR